MRAFFKKSTPDETEHYVSERGELSSAGRTRIGAAAAVQALILRMLVAIALQFFLLLLARAIFCQLKVIGASMKRIVAYIDGPQRASPVAIVEAFRIVVADLLYALA